VKFADLKCEGAQVIRGLEALQQVGWHFKTNALFNGVSLPARLQQPSIRQATVAGCQFWDCEPWGSKAVRRGIG
jgi:hypothetical protein